MHSSFAHIGSGKEEEMGCVSITISVTFFLLKSEANMAKCESSVTYSGWWVHGSLCVFLCFLVQSRACRKEALTQAPLGLSQLTHASHPSVMTRTALPLRSVWGNAA